MRIAKGKSLTEQDRIVMRQFALWLGRSSLLQILRARARALAGR